MAVMSLFPATVIDNATAYRWLNEGNAVAIDCRFDLANPELGEAAYRTAHLPRARYWHLERDLSAPPSGRNGRHPLPSPESFVALLAASGITRQTPVIVYDAADGLMASRAWWMLRACGISAAVLDGGWRAWCEAGLPSTAEPATPVPTAPITLDDWHLPVATAQTVRAALDDPGVLLIDARAPERYRGEHEPIDPVAGHIPGAVNRFYRENLDPETERFLPPERLRAAFAALLGAIPPQQTIHYCGSGVTACHNLLAMAHAGMPFGQLYAGSWSEWCADPSRPVARTPS